MSSRQTELPRRIAFVITELDDGGAERAFVRIATGLDPSKWQVAIYCLSTRGPLAEPLERAGLEVRCLDLAQGPSGVLSKFWHAWSAVRQLTDAFSEQPPVLVQTFLFHANLIGRLGASAARVSNVISGIRVAERRSRWRLTFDRATQGSVTKHVCVSEAVAKFSIEQSGLDPQKIVVIPNGVELAKFQSATPFEWRKLGISCEQSIEQSTDDQPASTRRAQAILSVGRLEDQKDPRSLLSAFRLIAPEFPLAQLVFVGEGHLKDELKGEAELRGLGQRVHCIGRRSDVPELLRGSSLFVLASQWEGMPNVVLEAAAAAVPIVSTTVEGVSELIPSEEFALLVRPGSASELAAAMRQSLSDPIAAQQRATRLQQHIARFSWDAVIKQYDELYESVLNASEAVACDARPHE